jgi:hypothetical protein
MKTPDYISSLMNDFYIEPVSLEEASGGEQENILGLIKDEPLPYGPITITFKQFDMSSHDKSGMAMSADGAITIGAVLEIQSEKGTQQCIPTTTYHQGRPPEMKTAFLKNSSIGFQLVGMNVATTKGAKSRVHVNIVGLGQMAHGGKKTPETLVADVSVKPFMSFVWISAAMIISGLIVAMVRRAKQSTT